MDNGKTWTDIGQATGADGTDGEDGIDGKDGTNGIFKSVTEDNDNVYFTLEDDSVITIPKSDNSKFAIAFDTTDIAILNGGESKRFPTQLRMQPKIRLSKPLHRMDGKSR